MGKPWLLELTFQPLTSLEWSGGAVGQASVEIIAVNQELLMGIGAWQAHPIEVGDNISEHVAPDGSSWKCCIEPATCGQCYTDDEWCALSIENCDACNGATVACPDDRRLVHEKVIGMATTSATLSSVLLISGLVALTH